MRAFLWIGMGVAFLGSVPPPAHAQTTHTVELDGVDFVPADITIAVGDTVRWVWVSGFHNVESGVITATGEGNPNGIFRSGDPTGTVATTYELSFDQAFLDAHPVANDAYDYYCIVHTHFDMRGTITVTTAECSTNADCDDGDACNGTETCVEGICVDATAPNCNDGNPCTDDSCDPATGCLNASDDSNPCDDGDPCTEDDACTNGVCGGTPSGLCCDVDADCDDGNVCSDDVCENGTCKRRFRSPCCSVDAQCDDGNPCTDDFCQDNVCFGVANTLACDDGVACTVDDACFHGACAGTPSIDGCCSRDSHCDDGDECTADTCVDHGCVHTPIEGCQGPADNPSGEENTTGDPSPDMGDMPAGCGATGTLPMMLLGSLGALRLIRRRRDAAR